MARGAEYTATTWRCFACEAREIAAAGFADDKGASTRGLQIAVERVDDGR